MDIFSKRLKKSCSFNFCVSLFLAWSPAAVLPVTPAWTSFSGMVGKQEAQSPDCYGD